MFSAARWSSRARPLVLLFVTCALAGNPALAATVPPGFSETLVVGGLADPTAMQFAPDGRLFVCEQRGTLRVIKNGVLLPAPFVTLTARSDGERGLLGVAFDPAFAVNQYVYVYYTATTPTIHNRISRFTASGDVAVPGSEFVLMDLPDLSVATNHNGGALNFGPDGKLYASVGENNVLANSQSLDTTLGKMLRLNTDGSIPPDNPFFSVTTGQNRAIWALGLRNPFTFAFDPGGTRMFINDVGELSWEEINEGIAGANYGWPATEGYTTAAGITSPRYAYDHATGCAITGGAFYSPLTRQFPPAYSGHYFFSDICGFWIKTFDPVSNTVTPFATGAIYIVDLKVANNGDLYYLDRDQGALHRISFVGGSVTADSVTPASGSGSTQTFALQYSNTSGATNIATAFALFTSTASASACLAHYDRPSNTVGLLNDAGTQYVSGVVGAAGVLTNSRCTITLGSSSVTLSGERLTLNLAITFAPMFAGATSIHLYAANAAGANSGWQMRGAWTVPSGPAAVVTADSVTPASGSGASQMFALRFSDTAGATDLGMAWVWFTASSASSSMSSCLAHYDRPSSTIGLLNDAGNQYMTGMAGAGGMLTNSQCAITLGGSTAMASGNTLTLNLAMTFTSMFAGAKNVIIYAANAAGTNSGWQTRGTWTAPAGGIAIVTADSVMPASGTGASRTFALQFSDTAGATDLSVAWVWFISSSAPSATSSCLAYYDRSSNVIGLLNDAGTQYVTGMVGVATTLMNTQCAIALGSTTRMLSGNMLTLNPAMTFSPMYAGAKNIMMYAANAAGTNSGWQTRGTWTVPGPPAAVVTADSVMPASGAGASQTFALRFSDTAGAMDLGMAWLWFTAPGASSPASSCLAYYDRPSGTIGLLNDAGTQYMSGVVGAAGMLMNSQCTIMLGGSTTPMFSGNTLTLNLAMSFTPVFAGAKNIYLYASSTSGPNSGWQVRGTWSVP